ncbi:AbrB/MazE/SpoVT family DNA-binding domain-containing protein [Geothrix sp. 21YS21S-2]|uniref:AbrB/MazE/SpoVT family DNA-binding domain-containing protein n=1 Tax=Geothrix sp. 21YS21S-2 TaxID=3068893 RepID=UPI0027BAD85B|nr:AbrB/MazE/SpoVT family DNA-binding domain-containing protein [Geothrix sp. 21YS21S-2]
MSLARSRITAQGQVSVPAAVMKKFGIGPGDYIDWELKDGNLQVRRVGKYTLGDVATALDLQEGVLHKTGPELLEGVKERMRRRHAVR